MRRRFLSAFERKQKSGYFYYGFGIPCLHPLVASFAAVPEVKGNGNTNRNSKNNGAGDDDQNDPNNSESGVVAPQSTVMLGADTVTVRLARSERLVGRLLVARVVIAVVATNGV